VPTYQYRCTACGEPLEAVQSFDDDPLTECPSCGGPLRKLFSSVGVVFKGSGFYRTDSRSSTEGKTATEVAKPASKEVAKPATKEVATTSTSQSSSTSSSTPSSSTS
jgi:putative FmdB family regulatory protein